jgi:parallel beta-helix repeat protein
MKPLAVTALILIATCASASTVPNLKGDGTTDDAPALQSAIDSGVGNIELGKGTYRLFTTITIDLDKSGFTSISGQGVARLVMAGSGPALKFIGTHDKSADPGGYKANVWEKQRMPQVDGLEIVGANAEADGIEFAGTMQLTVSRSTVRECRHAIHLSVLNRNILITDCHLYNNSGIGIFYDNVNLHQSNIIGCHISYCKGGGVVSHGGNVRNVQIGTCDIESNMAETSPPTANVWLDSTGGSIGEVAITGCTLQHSSKAPGCANILIQGGGDDPALYRRTGGSLTREGNVTITGNVFSDIQMNIHIQDSRGITVTGNTFWEGFEHDLLVERSGHIVVTGNNFDRNPRYAVNGFGGTENNGVKFSQCEDCTFASNIVSGVLRQRAAVDIAESKRFNISHNTIVDSDGTSLLLEQVKNSLIDGNILRDDREVEQRSAEPSLVIIGGGGNTLGTQQLSNGKAER